MFRGHFLEGHTAIGNKSPLRLNILFAIIDFIEPVDGDWYESV